MFGLVRCFPRFLLVSAFILTTAAASFSQTSIDDIHITPRQTSPEAIPGTSHIPSGFSVIHSNVALVTVPVTITDNLNRPVIGLDQDNFQLFEDKRPQEIKNFSKEDAPVSIGLIVDMSGSMSNKIEKTREAIRQFCEEANPQDEFFMITFADSPQLAADFTNQADDIESNSWLTRAKGRTSLLDAIYMGLRKMHDARYPRRPC